ncbi:hypothetical protein BN11_2780004 [Nostocoides australiense Ben110]|uniref:Uncharacterized protein n=1 Tax=Nostocoides australiense Ben110 TaxID=1193182 RepID=W6K3L1_9MICO|nr:hypothetical protein BN11_2780004 [Tetrasphaera australiensis Ben110]
MYQPCCRLLRNGERCFLSLRYA